MAPPVPHGTYMFAQNGDGGIVTGVRWRKSVVKYLIDDRVFYLPGMVGMKASVRKAFGLWGQALRGHVQFVETARKEDADAVITLKTPNLLRLFSGSVGHTDLIKDPRSPVEDTVKAETWIRGWLVPPFSKLDALTVALHEVGHVVGIRSHPIHNADPKSVMLDPLTQKRNNLSPMDVGTAVWVYENK